MQEDNIILNNAKKLRKEMTPWERKLWYLFLRNCGVKFYKQKPIGKYVVDFYCPNRMLVVELDGSGHCAEAQRQYDAVRTEFLNKKGLQVVRIFNSDIDRNFSGVCELLLRYLVDSNPSQSLRDSSPQGASQDNRKFCSAKLSTISNF